jgi:hypothetical protein
MIVWEPRNSFEVGTPLGRGRVLFVTCWAHDNEWTIALVNSAVVTFTQDRIRMGRSYTHGRGISDKQMKTYVDKSDDKS